MDIVACFLGDVVMNEIMVHVAMDWDNDLLMHDIVEQY